MVGKHHWFEDDEDTMDSKEGVEQEFKKLLGKIAEQGVKIMTVTPKGAIIPFSEFNKKAQPFPVLHQPTLEKPETLPLPVLLTDTFREQGWTW